MDIRSTKKIIFVLVALIFAVGISATVNAEDGVSAQPSQNLEDNNSDSVASFSILDKVAQENIRPMNEPEMEQVKGGVTMQDAIQFATSVQAGGVTGAEIGALAQQCFLGGGPCLVL